MSLSTMPFYSAVDSAGKTYVRYAAYTAPRLGRASWHLYTLDQDSSGYSLTSTSPGSLDTGGTVWEAYSGFVDGFAETLLIGHSTGYPTVGDTIGRPAGYLPYIVGTPSFVSYGGNVFVFYASTDATNTLATYMMYNGTSWSGPFEPAPGDFFGGSPVAVVFNGLLWVFFESDGYLTDVVYDGASWSLPYTISTIAGPPSVIVDTYANVLHVFYYEPSTGFLRDASLPAAGSWSYAKVDAADGGGCAPVLQSNTTQVYYTNGGVIRGATLVNGSWTYQAAIDGATYSSLCALQGGGATTDAVAGPIAIVSYAGGPHMFYSDSYTGDLRYAYWY